MREIVVRNLEDLIIGGESMIYIVAGALFVLIGALLDYSGHSLIGNMVLVIGILLLAKGKRQVYGERKIRGQTFKNHENGKGDGSN